MEPLGAPVDERVARRRVQPGPALTRWGLPWILLLGSVLALQRCAVGWQVADGRLRAALLLAALAAGFAFGWVVGSRDNSSWATWPPEGTLFARAVRRRWADFALGWWQFLWAVPSFALFATMAASVALLAVVRPVEMSGSLHAADVMWRAVVGAALGGALAHDLMTTNAEGITARGLHTSPVSFSHWRHLSHAVVDPQAGVIRVFPRKRPWLPRSVMVFDSRDDLEQAAGLIGRYLACLAPEEEPFGYRLRWVLFAVGAVCLTAALTLALLLLILLPGELVRVGWLATAVEQMPEAILALAFLMGSFLDAELAKLRGIKLKQIVSEAP